MTGGSQQLRQFRILMRDGWQIEKAAASVGMSIGEARLHVADDAKSPPPPEAFILIGDQPKEAPMAGRKKDEQISGEVPQPDLKKMKSIFLRDLKPAGEQSAKIRGDQSAAWKAIENDCHCNKRAAKALFKLQGESEELRDDFLRTFLLGLIELNLVPSDDLVDLMDGEEGKGGMLAGLVAGKKPMGTEGLAAVN